MRFKKRQSADVSTLGGPPGPNGRGQLPMLQMPDKLRYNLLCVMGEFVGTFLFLFFSFAGTQVSNTPMPAPGSPPNTSNLLYSSLAFGFSLTVNVWAFFRVTGGLFNPAVRKRQ
jgi:aquaporin related protein